MILTIDITNILSLPKTNTTAGISSGSSVSTNVMNTANFSADDFVVVGNLGDESSEIQSITSITDADTLVLGTLSLSHPSGTPITKVRYDQVSLERSSDNSSWSVIATVTLKGDQAQIEYNDTTGTTTSYYRFRFYNSTTATYSAYGNSYSVVSLPSAVDIIMGDVIKELGTEYDSVVTKDVIFSALGDTDLRIARTLIKTNKEIFKKIGELSNLTADTADYAMASEVVTITNVQIDYNGSGNYVQSKEIELELSPSIGSSFNEPYHSIYRKSSDGLIHLVLRNTPPQSVVNGLKLDYTVKPARITSTTSSLLTPQPMLYIDVFKNGIKEIIYRDYKDDLTKSKLFGDLFVGGLLDILSVTNTADLTEGATVISDSLGYALSAP